MAECSIYSSSLLYNVAILFTKDVAITIASKNCHTHTHARTQTHTRTDTHTHFQAAKNDLNHANGWTRSRIATCMTWYNTEQP